MIQKRRGPFSRSISTQNRGEIYFLRSIGDKNVESQMWPLAMQSSIMDVHLAMQSLIMEAWVSIGVCVYYLKRIKTESLSPHKVRGD